jgi:hypothetical protein
VVAVSILGQFHTTKGDFFLSRGDDPLFAETSISSNIVAGLQCHFLSNGLCPAPGIPGLFSTLEKNWKDNLDICYNVPKKNVR